MKCIAILHLLYLDLIEVVRVIARSGRTSILSHRQHSLTRCLPSKHTYGSIIDVDFFPISNLYKALLKTSSVSSLKWWLEVFLKCIYTVVIVMCIKPDQPYICLKVVQQSKDEC